MTSGRGILTGAIALFLLAFGFLGGMVVERIRFDRARTEVLRRFDAASQELRARLMRLEQSAAHGEPMDWRK